jgi:hypothetical protein
MCEFIRPLAWTIGFCSAGALEISKLQLRRWRIGNVKTPGCEWKCSEYLLKTIARSDQFPIG